MAIVELNPMLPAPHGAVGDLVFKHYDDKVVLTRKPRFENRVFSPTQRATQERFRQAMACAKAAFANPEIRSIYEQAVKTTGKPILSLMVADFFHSVIEARPGLGGPRKNATEKQGTGHNLSTLTILLRRTDDPGKVVLSVPKDLIGRSGRPRADPYCSTETNQALCASRRFGIASSGGYALPSTGCRLPRLNLAFHSWLASFSNSAEDRKETTHHKASIAGFSYLYHILDRQRNYPHDTHSNLWHCTPSLAVDHLLLETGTKADRHRYLSAER